MKANSYLICISFVLAEYFAAAAGYGFANSDPIKGTIAALVAAMCIFVIWMEVRPATFWYDDET